MATAPDGPSAGSRWRRRVLPAIAAATVLTACSEPSRPGGPAAERGRQVYLAQCIACHNPDPALAGPLGPPVKGTSRDLLEAKILRGTYPPGYTPKRSTSLMPAQPQLQPEIPNIAAFLQ
jgi:mono/diheme cytochrome c family protein